MRELRGAFPSPLVGEGGRAELGRMRGNWHEFADSDAVAKGLAGDVAGRLMDAISARGRAVLAVSGWTTPVRFFGELSKAEIDWGKVIVTLVD